MGLENGDEYVRDLVSEALETLAGCRHVHAVQAYFGPRLLRLWATIPSGVLSVTACLHQLCQTGDLAA
jgi:hypothetical protein